MDEMQVSRWFAETQSEGPVPREAPPLFRALFEELHMGDLDAPALTVRSQGDY